MAHHALFIGIGDGPRFQRAHIRERLLDFWLQSGKECVIHIHAAQVHRQADPGEFGVIFLKAFPPLQFCIIHKISGSD